MPLVTIHWLKFVGGFAAARGLVPSPSGAASSLGATVAILVTAVAAALVVRGLLLTRQTHQRLLARVRRGEERFRALAETSVSGLLIFDGQGWLIFANPRWAELTGITLSFGNGAQWVEAAAAPVRSLLREAFETVLAKGNRFEVRIPYRRADGDEGFADLNIDAECGREGRVHQLIVRLNDQTERFRAEARTADREQRYRLLAEHSSDLVLRLSQGGEILFASHAARRLLGCPPDALVGGDLPGLAHPEDRALLTALLAAGQSPSDALPFRIQAGGQGYHWVELTLNRLADERQWVASLRDIAARRRAEECRDEAERKLRESNRLLTLAEGLANVGHWHAATDRGQVLFSREAQALLGLAEPHASFAAATALVDPPDRHRLLRAVVRSTRAQGSEECRLRLERGRRTVLVRVQADRDSAGRLVATFGVITDVTDKLAAEQRLVTACEEARAAARAKATFLATMSHEIRTPMTGVLGMIELLRDDPLASERDAYLATLKESADLLMTVLNDVLDFSRLDSGRVEIAQRSFDLRETVTSTIHLFARNAAARQLALRLDWKAGDAARVIGDPVRLQQVLSNLVSNAIKFTDRGEVRLTVTATSARQGRRRWRIAVSDTGIGIDPGDQARLFEPFVQAEAGADRRFGGTGLGLAISRRLVAGMGGTLDLRSSSARGSTFVLRLDLPEAKAPLASPATPAGSLPLAATRPLDVLLAEDNRVNQLLVTALLRRRGHRVTAVADGRAAVMAAARRRFDLILMDMQMPRLDGRAAAAAIRAEPGPCAATPIVALTADASPARRDLYAAPPLDGFLAKPLDSAALEALLGELAAAGSGPAVADDASPAALVEQAPLEEIAAALGPARLRDLLDLFAAELAARPTAIRRALGRNDLPSAAAEAHSLKGAALSVGGVGVGAAAAAVEQAQVGTGGSLRLHRALGDLDRAVSATLALLPALAPAPRALAPAPTPRPPEPAIAQR